MCLSVGAVPHWNAQDSISRRTLTFGEAQDVVFHAVVTLGACHVQRPGSALGLSDFPGGGWGHSGLRDVSSRLGAVRGWASLPAWPSRAAELKESLAAMTTASSLSLGSEHPKAGRLCAQSSPSSGAPSTYGHQNPSRPLTALENKTQLV